MKLNFDMRGYDTVYELSFTKRLFSTMEEQLKEVHEKTIKELEEESNIEDEEDHMIFRSTLTGYEKDFEDQQISIRSSHLIRLYSLFEIHAQNLCKVVAKEKQLELNLKDFSHNGGMVKGVKLFLAKYAGVISFDHRTWHELNNLRVIRNHIVHEANSMWSTNGKTKLDKISKNEPKLPIIKHGEFTLSKEVCDHLHNAVTDFFKLAFETLGWRSFKN